MADIGRILIVGGGIAGLSAAAALSRQGFSVELIERSATWPTIGAGINLPAKGVRVLQALGLRAAAERNAAVLRRWGFFDRARCGAVRDQSRRVVVGGRSLARDDPRQASRGSLIRRSVGLAKARRFTHRLNAGRSQGPRQLQ
jgi:2-polyprenyl-6-methoxyphenol hydroxylase-like FAD-dependent oxidoreductase